MERIQAPVATASADASSGEACISCHGAVDGPRCSHCGASQRAGGYRVLRVIAQTAHSRMYLAEDGDGRRVALKELMFALVPGVEQVAAFEREAAVLRNLAHPQIPAFVRAFTEGTGVGMRLYLAQEFIEGESLLQRLARQRLTEEEAWTLAEQCLEVLHHLHTREPRLIHRDVKPANLILRERAPLALVDFGAVRDLARELTHGSTLVGTFGYMPPEQMGGTVDATSDLYALGATLLHGLTGIPPSDLLVDGLELRFDHKLQEVSRELRSFLERLLAPRRAGRFPTAEAALEELRAARARAAPRVETVEQPKATARAERRPLRGWALPVVTAFLMLGAAVTFFTSRPSFLAGPSTGDVRIDPYYQGGVQAVPAASAQAVPSGERPDHRYAVSWEKGIKTTLAVGEHYPVKAARADSSDPTVVSARVEGGQWSLIGLRPGRAQVVVQREGGGQDTWSVTVQ